MVFRSEALNSLTYRIQNTPNTAAFWRPILRWPAPQEQSKIQNPLFTPSLPPATKKSPPRPIRWKAQAPTRHNPTRRLCNLHLPRPQAPPTRYAWLATGLQTTSSSNRRRKDANASSPRLKLPPVFSPQWAQHEPAASQSARFVSSPQDLH